MTVATKTEFVCDCGHIASPTDCTPGYGYDRQGKTFCFTCCGENDKAAMIADGYATLYLSFDSDQFIDKSVHYRRIRFGSEGKGKVTNWPCTLSIPCHISVGRHNFARVRYDVWFRFDGSLWHGVQYGDNTQLCHCKRTKG